MNRTARRAELLKLARILDTEPSAVAFLADEDPTTLRILREGITDALFEKFRPGFTGFARVASLVPLTLSARISQRVLGPALSGRIAGEMKPETAIALADRLPDGFLADTCLQMEPGRARAVVRGFPTERAVTITQILVARGEYITMGRFVDVLPKDTLLAAAEAIDKPSDLLQIAFFVDNAPQIDYVIAHMSVTRRAAMIQAAAERDLWPEVIDMLARLTLETGCALAGQALSADAAILDADHLARMLHVAADEQPLYMADMAAGLTLDADAAARLRAATRHLDAPVRARVFAACRKPMSTRASPTRRQAGR